jgi:hypothetical protein
MANRLDSISIVTVLLVATLAIDLAGCASGPIKTAGSSANPIATTAMSSGQGQPRSVGTSISSNLQAPHESFHATGGLAIARAWHTAAKMSDGRVLIAGGNWTKPAQASSAEVYDPSSGTFLLTGSMNSINRATNAIGLKDGRVLVYGMRGSLDDHRDWAFEDFATEIYDPKTWTFSAGPSMQEGRAFPSATLLNSGKVLFTGGGTMQKAAPVLEHQPTEVAELYDPVANEFVETGPMTTPRFGHTAVMLKDGSVLIVGGSRAGGDLVRDAEIYDPASGRFRPTGSLNLGRIAPSAILLPDGNVLIVAGVANQRPVLDLELYDSRKGQFNLISMASVAGVPAKIAEAQYGTHYVTALADGRILFMAAIEINRKWFSVAGVYNVGTNTFTPVYGMNPPVRPDYSMTFAQRRPSPHCRRP